MKERETIHKQRFPSEFQESFMPIRSSTFQIGEKMKINKKNHLQRAQHFLLLGLIAVLLLPGMGVQAQAGAVPAPLAPTLTWEDLGVGERVISVNGESMNLQGTVFRVNEEFNLETTDEVAGYYSSTNLGDLGWVKVNTTPLPNGVTSLYYHADGYFAQVEFVGCEEDASLACLSVWQSNSVDVAYIQGNESVPEVLTTATFNKSSPADGATNVNTTVSLSWGKYTGNDLSHYRYCYDTTDNDECNGGWTSVWSGTSVAVSALAGNTTYYWQIQAVLDDNTKVDANSGNWWSFKTITANPPGFFTKTLPSNGAIGQSATPVLVWQPSSNATEYSYCVDTTNDNLCDSNWTSVGTNRSVTLLSGIGAGITYYWQVRATNSLGLTYADSGAWASFKTATGPFNDSIDSASVLSVPFQSNINTVAASIDSGTTNACSSNLGYASVWYRFSATSNRRLYFDTFGSTYDTFIAVWTKNANGTLNPITCNDNSDGLAQSRVNLPVTSGTTYYIQVAQKNTGSVPTVAPGGNLIFNLRSFWDVPGNYIFWKYIEGIYASGITGGCVTSPDLLYCPLSNVTRAQIAVFLLKSIHGSSYAPPPVGATTGFNDVPVGYWAAAWIKQLAAEGITGGCSPNNFCPENQVTRAQMAVFLLRSKHGSAYSPPAVGGSTGFTDVPVNYWAAAWIKQLAAESITSGCAANLYCPEQNVTRGQMAVFLSKTFNIPLLP